MSSAAVRACTTLLLAVSPALAAGPGAHAASRATVGVDDYPYRTSSPDRADRWNFLTRECTSFIAWRLNHDNGVAFSNSYGGRQWGNAAHWAELARAEGIRVDNTPAPGSVAQFDPGVQGRHPYGHVAYVVKTDGNRALIEEYNHHRFRYDQRWIPKDGINFIHFKDHP